jgi:hypothetical protein
MTSLCSVVLHFSLLILHFLYMSLIRGAAILFVLLILATLYGDNVKSWWGSFSQRIRKDVSYRLNPQARKEILVNELTAKLQSAGDTVKRAAQGAPETIRHELEAALTTLNQSQDLLKDVSQIDSKLENQGLLQKSIGLLSPIFSANKNAVCETPQPTHR